MKLNIWKILFFLVTLVSAPFLGAQTPALTTLTLAEAVKEARAANLGLQVEGLKVDIKSGTTTFRSISSTRRCPWAAGWSGSMIPGSPT